MCEMKIEPDQWHSFPLGLLSWVKQWIVVAKTSKFQWKLCFVYEMWLSSEWCMKSWCQLKVMFQWHFYNSKLCLPFAWSRVQQLTIYQYYTIGKSKYTKHWTKPGLKYTKHGTIPATILKCSLLEYLLNRYKISYREKILRFISYKSIILFQFHANCSNSTEQW